MHKFLYIILGAIITVIFLLDRVLRNRLPKIIPYNLTELSFLLMISTCIILLGIIYAITRKNTPKTTIFTIFLQKTIHAFYIYVNDTFYSEKVIYKIVVWLFQRKLLLVFCISFVKFLRIGMALIFIIEAIFLNKIMLFYILFPLLAIPVLFSYILFSLNNFYDKQIALLDKQIEIHHITYNNNPNQLHYMDYAANYDIISAQQWIQEKAWHELKLTNKSFKNTRVIKEEFIQEQYPLLTLVEARKLFPYNTILQNTGRIAANNVRLYCILYYWNEANYKIFSVLTLIILSMYLLAWSYILFKSFHTLKDFTITLKVLEILAQYTTTNPFENP